MNLTLPLKSFCAFLIQVNTFFFFFFLPLVWFDNEPYLDPDHPATVNDCSVVIQAKSMIGETSEKSLHIFGSKHISVRYYCLYYSGRLCNFKLRVTGLQKSFNERLLSFQVNLIGLQKKSKIAHSIAFLVKYLKLFVQSFLCFHMIYLKKIKFCRF